MLALWVVYSDAWFWSWTGTTTLAPTVDYEGSGSPVGSGEPPSENIATVGAEIIDEGDGLQKIVQTWDETTEAARLTTTTQPQNEPALEKETEEAISSDALNPGNGTSSLKGIGSGETDHLSFKGNVSRLGPGIKFELASSDTGAGDSEFRSESRFGTRPKTRWESGFESERHSKKKQHEEVTPTDLRLDSRGSVVSQAHELKMKSQKTTWITRNRTDEGHNLESTKSEQNFGFSVKTPSNIRGNRNHRHSPKWSANDFNLTKNFDPKNSTLAIDANNSVDTTLLIQSNQTMEVSQLPASESTVKQGVLLNQVLQPRSASFFSQALFPTQNPTSTRKTLFSQRQTVSKKADVTTIPSSIDPQVLSQASVTTRRVITSQISHISNVTQTSVSEPEPSLATLMSHPTVSSSVPTKSHTELIQSALVIESPQCLSLDSTLPFCTFMVGEQFVVPNYLNQTTVEEVQVLLNNWAWLLRSHCHHSLEWFFCLLLVPKCGSLVPLPVLPCRSFCEVLRDSCWTLLDEGRLPVECHTLPDEEDDGYQCLSVSNQKGKHWFK